jgi:hypothetical protein
MINSCVAPESAMASCEGNVAAACANSSVVGGENGILGDTFEATTVSTSSSGSDVAGKQVWVGCDKSSVT